MRLPAFALALLLPGLSARAFDVQDTRVLSDPALSSNRLAFAYANDLYTAALDGSDVRRLTSHPGIESSPRFSPDGRWIAFTGQYDGNGDVYVVAASGGVPRRLTWHPAADSALGFTPDSKAVLFASPREAYTNRYQRLFTVPVLGGWPTRLPIPNASKAAVSPDGGTVAYVPLSEPFHQWKHYRGGMHSRLLLFDTRTEDVKQVPQPAGRCNDTDPVWLGSELYFRSDRDGEFNLYRHDAGSAQVVRLTSHADFPVLALSASGGRVLYEQAGYLHLLDVKGGQAQRLKIGVAADLLETRPRYAKGAKYARNWAVSPSGARAALEFRGEILTLPREKGDERNLTRSPAANDRSPAWSPDGRSLAWFSDATGEYALYVAPQDGKGAARRIDLHGAGFYEDLRWSPDGKLLSYSDNARALFIVELQSGASTRVDQDPIYGPERVLHQAWSPDSRFLAYTRNSPTYMNRIWLYSLAQKKSLPVTDGLEDARFPAFDPNGKYLYFAVSTDAGPVQDWFAQSNADMAASRALYLAVLAKGVPSPLARQSDEEGAPKPGKGEDDEKKPAPPPEVRVDPDGLDQRILALPLKPAGYRGLQVAKTGQLLYLREPGAERPEGETSLNRYDLEKRKEDTLLERADAFQLSGDGKRVLVKVKDDWSLVDLLDKLELDKFKLPVGNLQVRVEPVAEWRQIFDEAWRINRDYFYDPGFHGADWPALRAKYAAFLPDVTSRRDLTRVMQWLFSELSVGHHRLAGGDSLADGVESVPGGLLGADYAVADGRYRFERVFGGLNWNPELRAPLSEPGVDVRAGEYLLAVEGQDLRPPEDLFARFERTAGRTVEISVGPYADGRGARTVQVVPIDNELQLRNRDWVERNLRRVTEATQGRVAYVYVPNTADLGHTYFKRYFYPQADRDAIIVDERHNGGGSVADYYIDLLRRPAISHWAMRYGADLRTPIAGILGPKVMLIDETAGSGGDLLPWMFRKLGLGTLVGKRTWGGLVGILGFPVLMDGGVVTAPNLAIWTEEGFIVENEGVPPDVEVEQTPRDVIAGKDPQLERAIAIALEQLERNPPAKATRPPFPVRAR